MHTHGQQVVLRPCLPPLRQDLSLGPEDQQLGPTGGPRKPRGFSFLSSPPGITVEYFQAASLMLVSAIQIQLWPSSVAKALPAVEPLPGPELLEKLDHVVHSSNLWPSLHKVKGGMGGEGCALHPGARHRRHRSYSVLSAKMITSGDLEALRT